MRKKTNGAKKQEKPPRFDEHAGGRPRTAFVRDVLAKVVRHRLLGHAQDEGELADLPSDAALGTILAAE